MYLFKYERIQVLVEVVSMNVKRASIKSIKSRYNFNCSYLLAHLFLYTNEINICLKIIMK